MRNEQTSVSSGLAELVVTDLQTDTLSGSLPFPLTKVATQILSIISTKGGEGKSTQGAYLAGFTADAGLKTLLIDGDYSQPTSCSIYHLDYEAPCGLYELLTQT
ncbi:TPA: ParA family protein, partial [Salmonella enterica]